jgi:hypothetical protein
LAQLLELGTFAGRIGQSFRLLLDASTTVETRLVEALASGAERAAPGRRQPFSIVLLGPAEPVLPQRTYTVEHDQLASFELFIVPIGPDGPGMRYEAVFG